MKTKTKKLTDAARDLAGRPEHIRYARVLARRFARKYPRLADEFEPAAFYGLILAARTFDPARRVPFASHAHFRVVGSLRDVLDSWIPKGFRDAKRGHPRTYSLDAKISRSLWRKDDRYQPSSYLELFEADDDPVGSEMESEEAIRRILSLLPRNYRRALATEYTVAHESTADAARVSGMGAIRLNQLKRRGHRKLREFGREIRREVGLD